MVNPKRLMVKQAEEILKEYAEILLRPNRDCRCWPHITALRNAIITWYVAKNMTNGPKSSTTKAG